ncbi:Transcription factor bHLH25 [Glycine soja]
MAQEMEEYDDVLNESHHGSFDEQEFLREILEEQPENLSPQRENICSTSPTNSTVSFDEAISFNYASGSTLHKSNSSNSIKSLKRSSSSSVSPASTTTTTTTTYLLSFDTSIVEPITLKPSPKLDVVKDGSEFDALMPQTQPKKKVRRSCETRHHIIAERKRRQELTGSIIALSATIPGLKKMDKAYVLREAVNYTKQLQERVKELENQNKVDSAAFIKKSEASSDKNTGNCETNKEISLFEVEARVLDKEVLIGIHCEKQKDIVFKIHALLRNLHLSTTSSTVLPFGTSTLIINIIAQMNGEYSMTKDDLVKKLREYLLEMYDMQ